MIIPIDQGILVYKVQHQSGACTGFLKRVGSQATTVSEASRGPGAGAPGNFLTELYAKPIGLRISIQKVQSS